jgi:hypothetical protein
MAISIEGWAIDMVCVLGDLKRPFGEGVLVPMLLASMPAPTLRCALADCFSAWMSVAYASVAGSLLHTLVHGTGAFYFGITDNTHSRFFQHKAGVLARHTKGDWMMRGMVSLAPGGQSTGMVPGSSPERVLFACAKRNNIRRNL